MTALTVSHVPGSSNCYPQAGVSRQVLVGPVEGKEIWKGPAGLGGVLKCTPS